MAHIPVLLKETMEGLDINKNDIVLDGTINSAGHSLEICKLLSENGILIGIDQDSNALKKAEEQLKGQKCKIFLKHENFRNLDKVLDELKIEKIDKVLFDLGLSSNQLEESGRGFSFLKDEPLKMTFNPNPKSTDITAWEIINKWDEENIADVIYGYGGEKFSRRIASNVIKERQEKPIDTTYELVEIIKRSVPSWYGRGKTHPATKTFQALRITVNDEMRSTKEGIEKAVERLRSGGKLAVITFHSTEDRLIKVFFKEKQKEGGFIIITKKPIPPTEEEVKNNPRSRSAKLRILQKE